MSSADRRLGETPLLHDDVSVVASTLGSWTEVGTGSRLLNTTLGDYSYCERLCDLANTEVGRFSNIASMVRIGATDHPMDRASMHHFQYRSSRYFSDVEDDTDWFDRRAARRTIIGHDTWLGHAAQVKPEVRVGTGAVVASGAVVTKDVPAYAIVAGVPARVIRMRFDSSTVRRLLSLAWWDWDHRLLRERLEDFRRLDAAEFLDRYERP